MSARVAILCSGQASQHPGMFALTGAAPEAAPVFEAAAAVLGTDPRRFVAEASDDALFANVAGQVLCCTQGLAAWAMLGDARPAEIVVAGYSAGELAAWGIAGALPADRILPLAKARADAMDRAAPPGAGLAAIAGLAPARLAALPGRTGVEIAIRIASDRCVVGGTRAALEDCVEQARAAGAQARILQVAVPSHTGVMREAAAAFAELLAAEPVRRVGPGIRLLSGIDAETVRDPHAGLARLARQIAHPIAWSDCLQACAEAGATTFLELGPGDGLARMAEAACPGVRARGIEAFRTPEGVASFLAG